MKSDPVETALKITTTTDGVIFSVHVQPRASRNEICGIHGNELKIRLTSPPVEGEANKLCIEFFAKLLKVPKSDITITAGDKSRHKTLKVSGATAETVLQLLGK